jgi:hypothetical protein
MVACIAADGYHMKPFIILERKIIEPDILSDGYGQFHVSMVHQENLFTTASLFDRWSDEKHRSQFSYTAKVILLMDCLGAHHIDAFLHKCSEKNVEVAFFVARSSDQ